MPILPENRHRYPGGSPQSREWKEIVERVRRRSLNICEGEMVGYDCSAINGEPHPVTGSKVVLTVAHMDHMPENSHLDNLLHLCQRCHNRYDASHRAGTRKRRRRRTMPHVQGQLFE